MEQALDTFKWTMWTPFRFCLVRAKRQTWVVDASACETICIGKDHRTTNLLLKIPGAMARAPRFSQARNVGAWKSEDPNAQKENIDSKLQAMAIMSRPRKRANTSSIYCKAERNIVDSFIESCQLPEMQGSDAVRTAVDNNFSEFGASLRICGKNVQSRQGETREDELL